ncbi:MAG: hypothetical protein N4A49_11515 [Marinifilaceae bacterium]|jgi:hypothetical protein|nr:hypothetical protein [Marinifilaceae bacterium]
MKNNQLRKLVFYGIIILFAFNLNSCKQIKKEINKTKNTAKRAVSKQTRKVKNSFKPKNIKRQFANKSAEERKFKEFFKINMSRDIKNILYNIDIDGAAHTYMFAFECNEETCQKIILSQNLSSIDKNKLVGISVNHNLSWWNQELISNLPLYTDVDSTKSQKYLWYDGDNKKAYFYQNKK